MAASNNSMFGFFLDALKEGERPNATQSAAEFASALGSALRSGALVGRRPDEGATERVLRAVSMAETPPALAALKEATGLDIDTLVRTVNDAVAAGLLRRMTLDDGSAPLSLTPDGQSMIS